MRFFPREYRFPLAVALVVHVAIFATLIVLSLTEDRRSLTGPSDGGVVQVALISAPAPPPPSAPRQTEPSPPREESRAAATPRPQPTPEPKKPDPTPAPREESRPTPKPQPTPAPRTPAPTPNVEKPEVKVERTPAPTPRPRATPAPTPRAQPTRAAPTPKPEPTRGAALSPQDSQRLWPQRSPGNPSTSTSTTTRPQPNTSASSRPSTGSSSAVTEVTSGATTLKGTGLPDYYARAALDKLARFFRVPPDQQQDITALISLRINRDGTITRISIARSCGNRELDQLAVKALENCRRFNPFPDDFTHPFVDVEIAFRFIQ